MASASYPPVRPPSTNPPGLLDDVLRKVHEHPQFLPREAARAVRCCILLELLDTIATAGGPGRGVDKWMAACCAAEGGDA